MAQPQESPGPRPEVLSHNNNDGVTIVKNIHQTIFLDSPLKRGEGLLLLTPVVAPEELLSGGTATATVLGSTSRDPYEDLGRALAAAANKRFGGVKHVPYTARGGITSTHAEFTGQAGAVIFVVSGPPRLGQPDQLELARAVRRLCCRGNGDEKPLVVVLACRDDDFSRAGAVEDFSAVIRVAELSPKNVASIAALILDGGCRAAGPASHRPAPVAHKTSQP